MAKAHRGRTLKAEKNQSGRGVCPVCKRGGVKVLYTQKIDEKEVSSCKACKAAIGRGKMKSQLAALTAS